MGCSIRIFFAEQHVESVIGCASILGTEWIDLLSFVLNSWGHRKRFVEALGAGGRSGWNQLFDRIGICGGILLLLIFVGLSYLKPIPF